MKSTKLSKIEKQLIDVLKMRLTIENLNYQEKELLEIIKKELNIHGDKSISANNFDLKEINNFVDKIFETIKNQNEILHNINYKEKIRNDIRIIKIGKKPINIDNKRNNSANHSYSQYTNNSSFSSIDKSFSDCLRNNICNNNKNEVRNKTILKFNLYEKNQKRSIKFYQVNTNVQKEIEKEKVHIEDKIISDFNINLINNRNHNLELKQLLNKFK